MQRLAVIPGSFTLEAAAVVATEPSDIDAFDLMSSLVEQNLVRRLEVADGTSRFTMLATIREFALERLEESGDANATRDRHAMWAMSFAEEAQRHLEGPESTAWLLRRPPRIKPRAALAWAETRHDATVALRLSVALFRYWYIYGRLHEDVINCVVPWRRPTMMTFPRRCARERCISRPTSCSTSVSSMPPRIG